MRGTVAEYLHITQTDVCRNSSTVLKLQLQSKLQSL
jgi:hypothetical protein